MAFGGNVPSNHDGMAAFDAGDGRVLLIRNHEVNGSLGAFTTHPDVPVYDTAAPAGDTYVLVDLFGNVERTWPALAGTQMNCSGGPTPWGSWIACEETVNGRDVFDDFTRNVPPPPPPLPPNPETTYVQNPRLQQTHGYIFEVPANGVASAEPVTQAGRFSHEAAVFDPISGSIYLTEDNFGFGSGFYRYDPPVNPRRAKRIEDGGTLWMLAVAGTSQANLSGSQVRGTKYAVRWVQIADPNPQFPMDNGLPTVTNNQAISNVGNQGWDDGGAVFSRLEGVTWDKGVVYFTSTQGGGTAEPVDWDVSAEDQEWIRARHRAGVGLPPESRDPGGRLPVDQHGRSATARQRHRQPTRHADPLRGQRRSEPAAGAHQVGRPRHVRRSAPISRRWSSPAPPSPRTARPCSSTSTPARP